MIKVYHTLIDYKSLDYRNYTWDKKIAREFDRGFFKMFKGFDNITFNDFFQVIKHNFERPLTQNLQTTIVHLDVR